MCARLRWSTWFLLPEYPCNSLRSFAKFGETPAVSGSWKLWNSVTAYPNNSNNPTLLHMFGSFVVGVDFETSGRKICNFPSLPWKLIHVWQESLVFEVLGKRLQNFMVLFSQVCGIGRVYILGKMFSANCCLIWVFIQSSACNAVFAFLLKHLKSWY